MRIFACESVSGEALTELSKGNKEKAKQVLLSFSDPTTEPIAKSAGRKGAVGAFKESRWLMVNNLCPTSQN